MNALQVFPNIIGLIGLSGLVAVTAREKLTGEVTSVGSTWSVDKRCPSVVRCRLAAV
jgi:hypothetical protein